MGIFLGLVVGKPLGVFLFSRLVVWLKWGELPQGATWAGVFGVSCLAGIGFTMSIFINNLAFADPATVSNGKIAILVASLAAVIVGFVFTRTMVKRKEKPED